MQTHPEEQLLFAGPHPILNAYTPICLGGPCGPRVKGEPPRNKILPCKPTPKSNFCLLAPTQFLTLQGISDGVSMGGTPGGLTFWVTPWLGAEPG